MTPRSLLPGALLFVASAAYGQTGGTQLVADPASSHIYVVTHRSGLFSFLGHEHVVLAPTWSADLCWDEVSGSSAKITIDARELVIDTDEAREIADKGRGPSPSQRDDIQKKLLDARRLDVERYPELRFETVSIRHNSSGLTLHGRLTIKGVTREVEFPASVEPLAGEQKRLRAHFRVRQSHFDIKPESIAGVVKVSDPVDIYIVLTTRPGDACPGEAE